MVLDRKTNFFLVKRWFWTGKPTFSEEKDGLGMKNQFFPREKMVLARKTIFFLGKTKKNIFLVSGRIVSQKMVFLFFPRKKLVCLPKTIFFLGKSWLSCPKPSFS